MTTLTRSTSHRLLTPQMAALALAALRLGIVVERQQLRWICRVDGCAAHPDTDWSGNDHFLCDRCGAEIGRRLALEEEK